MCPQLHNVWFRGVTEKIFWGGKVIFLCHFFPLDQKKFPGQKSLGALCPPAPRLLRHWFGSQTTLFHFRWKWGCSPFPNFSLYSPRLEHRMWRTIHVKNDWCFPSNTASNIRPKSLPDIPVYLQQIHSVLLANMAVSFLIKVKLRAYILGQSLHEHDEAASSRRWIFAANQNRCKVELKFIPRLLDQDPYHCEANYMLYLVHVNDWLKTFY